MTHTSKHRVWSPKRRLVRNIPETFKGLGLSQQNCVWVTKHDACWYTTSVFRSCKHFMNFQDQGYILSLFVS